jgi:hypothetical protein
VTILPLQPAISRAFRQEIHREALKTLSAKFYRVSIPGDGGRWLGMPAGMAKLTAK